MGTSPSGFPASPPPPPPPLSNPCSNAGKAAAVAGTAAVLCGYGLT